MKAACCAALTELMRNDHNSQQIVSNNGVYALATLILPDRTRCKATETLQVCVPAPVSELRIW